MAKSTTKKVRGKEIRVSKGKEPKTAEAVGLFEDLENSDPYEKVAIQDVLMPWFKRAYPETQPVDRDNGIAYHLDGKKTVKEPTRENVGGLFFGKHLNELLEKARAQEPLVQRDVVYHKKGNMKVMPVVHRLTALRIAQVIAKLHPPKRFG